jgi:crotonobetainyl-CoA:carnitine CoA-transferase CaiB-like acyl-CoA transferase
VFHGVNGNKRGFTVDLTTPEGVELFERLLGTADVLAENYTPRVMEKFGFDWEHVHDSHPSVVMLRMPAFGLDGPWRDRTGFAQTMECLSGMAWLTGFPDGPPLLVRGACDPIAGLHSVIATLLALFERDRDGRGVLVEAAMVEAALNAAAEQVAEFGATGIELMRDGNRGPDAAPQGVYPCAGDDGWVAIAVTTDQQWIALRQTLALGALTGPGFDTLDGRRRQHDEIDTSIAAVTADRDAAELVATLTAAGVPAEVVISARDVAHNEQMLARGLFETEHHPVTGDHPIPVLPFRFSRVDGWLRAPAPTLGQDNEPILAELGFDGPAVDSLREAGVIGERPAGS